jgi:hypothetical protein
MAALESILGNAPELYQGWGGGGMRSVQGLPVPPAL